MIVTVTMNPAIDKTVSLETFVHGGLNRVKHILVDAGGKGINVSKTIKALGGDSIATGFIGGNNGVAIVDMLEREQINAEFVTVGGETRINTKIAEADGTVTELNEAGPEISEDAQKKLEEQLMQYAKEGTWFVLSGSVPAGVPKSIYGDIIRKVHEKGAKVFLDADGELFTQSLAAKPDVIKPNRIELEKYIDADHSLTEEELLCVGNDLLGQGIETVIISLGHEGALFLKRNQVIKCPAISAPVHSTVGAGDALVAAFTYGMDQGEDFETCTKLGIATSAGAVSTDGTKPPTRQMVDTLLQHVRIIKM
ncbi:MAG: 1-phosphofructokinase [Tyzzerella sp.]|nr:1-phosphofructokinase [Tyzzerella sp.]